MDTWTPTPEANTNWSTRRGGSTRRIIEGTTRRRRITEQGSIRIIERFVLRWNIPPTPTGIWHPS